MLQTRSQYFWFWGILILGLVLFNNSPSWGQATKLRFSSVPFIGAMPSYVALHQGFFKDEGLEIELKDNPGGWMSLKELFEGTADIAATAELPIVYSVFDKKKYTDFARKDFYVIGDMIYSQPDVQQLIARKDRGINSPQDLKGKKIGVFRGTTLDYYMDLFFRDYRIKYSEVELIDMNVFELTDAIVRGDLDAIFTWQPHAYTAQKKLGDNAIVMKSRASYSTPWLIVVMKDFAEKNPQVLEKFLRAIVRAEKFIKSKPEEAKKIHAEMSKTDLKTIDILFDIVDFDLSLSSGLITILEGESKWLIRRKTYETTEIPNFFDYLYFAPLKKVKPEGVQISR